MSNIINPPIDYYDNESNWGNYQYISLSDLVNNFITNQVGNDKLLNNVKRYNVLYHMKRGIQEFTFDALKEIKTLELELNDNLQIPLPHDYVSYVRISWVDSNGKLHPMSMNPNSKLSKAYLQDHEYNILFDEEGYPLEANESEMQKKYRQYDFVSNIEGECNDECGYYNKSDFRYGSDPTRNGNGYFTIDKRKGVVAFSSNVGGELIVIEYVSDGLEYDSNEVMIHKFAEKALYDYVKLELLRNKYGIQEYIINRTKRDYDTSFRNATIRLQEIRLNELTFHIRGRKKWIK